MPLLAFNVDDESFSIGILGFEISIIYKMKLTDDRKAILVKKIAKLKKCRDDIRDDETIDLELRHIVVKNTDIFILELEKRMCD